MKGNKLSNRALAVSLIAVLAFLYVPGDWAVYILSKMGVPVPAWSRIAIAGAKYLSSCLAFAVVWTTGEDRIDDRDIRLLRMAFAFLIAADFFMVALFPVLSALGRNPPEWINTAGMVFFMAVQTCLIARHLRNSRSLFAGTRRAAVKNAAVELIILLAAAIPVTAAVSAAGKTALPVLAVYGVYLLLSLYTAWGVFRRGFYPPLNQWLIALGMTFFFLCDLNVGLSGLNDFATTLVWLFYTPALMMLSLSGVDFGKRKALRSART